MLEIRYSTVRNWLNRVNGSSGAEEHDSQDRVQYWVADVLNANHLEMRSKKQSQLIGLLIADLLTRDPSQLDDVLAILEPEGRDFELVPETPVTPEN